MITPNIVNAYRCSRFAQARLAAIHRVCGQERSCEDAVPVSIYVFFCTKVGKKIIMLHSFVKKSQKTPKKEIKIAKTRMSEVIENETF